MTGGFTAVHPMFWPHQDNPANERMRKKLMAKLQRAADRVINRILRECALWMIARPDETLLALGEALRQLQERAADDPSYCYRTAQLDYILDLTLHRAAEAERDGLITITLIGDKTDAPIR